MLQVCLKIKGLGTELGLDQSAEVISQNPVNCLCVLIKSFQPFLKPKLTNPNQSSNSIPENTIEVPILFSLLALSFSYYLMLLLIRLLFTPGFSSCPYIEAERFHCMALILGLSQLFCYFIASTNKSCN